MVRWWFHYLNTGDFSSYQPPRVDDAAQLPCLTNSLLIVIGLVLHFNGFGAGWYHTTLRQFLRSILNYSLQVGNLLFYLQHIPE